MSNKKILLLGLPSTGKTTFIAALWFHVTWAGQHTLELDTLAEGDDEYLNKIRDEWAQYAIVPRTKLTDLKNQKVLMKLKVVSSQQKLILDVPDFSGETFKEQFKNREWSEDFDKQLEDIGGIILFVSSSDPNSTPKFIEKAKELENILGDMNPEAFQQQTTEQVIPKEFNHEFVSSQVKMVDALQLILNKKRKQIPIKLSIAISAWDGVRSIFTEEGIDPKKWIVTQFPLLDQYLQSNSESFIARYFGVSAQGCDYTKPESLQQLMSKQPLDRVIVQEDAEISSDITKPILWLIS